MAMFQNFNMPYVSESGSGFLFLHVTSCMHATIQTRQKSIEFLLIPILDTMGTGDHLWIGLINPMEEACEDADCENKLSWASDGSSFTTMHSSQSGHKVSRDFKRLIT